MPRGHARRLRRHARLHGPRGAAQDLRRDGAPNENQAHSHPRRKIRRLHGRRLRARLGQAGHLHGAGDRRAQSRGGPARRASRALAGDRLHRRARSQDQVPQGLPGSGRCAGLRARDQAQRHGRRCRALSRHGAPGVPRRGFRNARAGAPAVSRQRRAGGRRRSGHGAARRAAIRSRADLSPEALGRNYPLKASVLGDVKVTLARMLESADGKTAAKRKPWLEKSRAICAEWYSKYGPMLESEAVPIRPERMCGELTKNLPEDAIVVVDTGHAGMWMGGMVDLRAPTQSYMRSAGHLGWAFPAGLGAKCGAPERPVVVFTGDAGLWYHIGEIETAVRWKINSVTVVNNNASGNQSKRGFDRVYGGQQTEQARELWTYRPVNFARIAEEIGALGIRVEKPGELAPAILRALEADRPAIVDVVTDIEALAPVAAT